MRKFLDRFLPKHSRFWLALVVIYNFSVYFGTQALIKGRTMHNLSGSLDAKIPFLPWTVSIYLGCYVFWIVNYIMAAYDDAETARRFALSDILGKTVCLVFYVVYPTTMNRAVLSGEGFWIDVVRWLYATDGASDLFPSIHCLVSWLCFIGVRDKTWVPKWYKWFSAVFALLVFASTLTVKQHVWVDLVAGLVLAEACYFITHHISFSKVTK